MVLKWVEQAQSLFGVVLNEAQVAQFADYEAMLLDWNARFNLTAIRDLEGIRLKHFLDSLSCVMAFPSDLDEPNIIDVGTGAGFPGLPLKIVYPKSFLTLVESIKKKANFCGELTRVLGLKRVLISSERAETLGQDWEHREFYDIALARAVAAMPTLVEYLLPLVKVGGRAIIQKGSSAKRVGCICAFASNASDFWVEIPSPAASELRRVLRFCEKPAVANLKKMSLFASSIRARSYKLSFRTAESTSGAG